VGPNVLIGLSIVAGTLFVRSFLNIRQTAPHLSPIFSFLFGIGWLMAIGNLLAYNYWTSKLTDFLMMLDVLLMFGMGVYVMRRGFPPARYFMLAWSFFLIAVFVAALHNAGLLPGTPLIDIAVMLGVVSQVTLLSIGLGARFEQMRQEKELAQLQLIHQLRENDRVRSRIARDLHDDVGSTLSSIAILSQVAQRQFTKQQEGTPELLGRISRSAQKVLDTMSDIVWTTHPDNDTLGRLATRMREFAAEILESQDIHYLIDVAPEVLPLRLPNNRHYDFYLIFKEAINNAAKYSEATQVDVHVSRQREQLLMVVRDNGRGFDLDRVNGTGNGLKNMQQRANKINAQLKIQTALGQGTTLQLSCPLT
jgi:signal transduction histidine kinase